MEKTFEISRRFKKRIENSKNFTNTRKDTNNIILDTQTATDLNNNIFSQHSQQLTAGITGQAVDTLVWDATIAGIVSSSSILVSPLTNSNELKYDNSVSQVQNTVKMTAGSATSSVVVGAVNALGSTSQFIRLETPQSGNARIEHQVVGSTKRSLALTTGGNLLITADNINLNSSGRLIVPSLTSSNILDYNDGSLKIINGTTGGAGNVLLLLQNNSNTAGATTFETFKNDLPTATGGDVIGSWSATCNTNIGKTEISRISQIAYGVGASNNDGGIALTCKVNSTIANFLVCNGGAGAGEIQVFKPITAPTGDIVLTTATSSGIGNVDVIAKGNVNIISNSAGGFIDLTAVSSVSLTATGDNLVLRGGTLAQLEGTGTGADVIIKPETSAGDLVFEGTNIQSSSSGSNSGEHLRIKLNGTYYKIRLENDV
jgi:hypothetical protein